MIKVVWDENFKRKYKKITKNNLLLKNSFWKKFEIFVEEPFSSLLKTHKLTGKMKDCWAFSVEYNCRVIFQIMENEEILLIDIGSHDEVY